MIKIVTTLAFALMGFVVVTGWMFGTVLDMCVFLWLIHKTRIDLLGLPT